MSQDCRARRLWTRQCCPSLMEAEALVTQFNPPQRRKRLRYGTVGQNESFTFNFIKLVLDLLITIGLLTSYAAFITSVNRTSFSQKPFRYPVGIFWSSRRCGTSSNRVGRYRSGRICFKKAMTRSLGRHKPYRRPDPEIAQNRVTFL